MKFFQISKCIFRNTPGKKIIIYTLHRSVFSHLFIVVYASANEVSLLAAKRQRVSRRLFYSLGEAYVSRFFFCRVESN